MSEQVCGILYVVATPIGHLEDFSPRAVRVLGEVDLIAAEDTRHSGHLLARFGIRTRLVSYHDFNEQNRSRMLIDELLAGSNIALISDAGTPLISDPGYRLVRSAHEHNIRVVPVPGPSALISALSVAGLPAERFIFAGYPPARRPARIRYLEGLKAESRTVVLYEAPHRIVDLLKDMQAVYGAQRRIAVARELTKKFESVQTGAVTDLLAEYKGNEDRRRGEFVVIVEGVKGGAARLPAVDSKQMLALLLEELPLKTAAAIVSQVTGASKNELYRKGLEMQKKSP